MSADEGDDTISMAPVNGDSHPDMAATATPAKRKRSVQEDKPAAESTSSTSRESANLHESLRSLLGLLLQHDTDLQLLSCPFPSSATKPRAKRAKTSGDQDTSNIRARVESNHYNTLQEFLSDIERASAAVIDRNQNQTNGANAEGAALTEVVNRIAAFKKNMNSLIGQSFVNQSDVKVEISEEDDEQPLSSVPTVGVREDKRVLTLLGGTQAQPRQLWSSLQKTVKVPLHSSESGAEKVVEVQEPLREDGLPNGITTTLAVPFNLDSANKPKRTFGDVFAPRSGLPPAEPRKRRRSVSVSWIDPFDLTMDVRNFSGERSNHNLTPFPSGQWLQYGAVSSSSPYWARVEKQNEDAKFGSKYGDPSLGPVDDPSVLLGVYSSFAPSFDSSNAVISEDQKNLVWWGQRGARRLRTLLARAQPELEEDTEAIDLEAIDKIDDGMLNELVESQKPKDYSEYLAQYEQASKEDVESREIDDVLTEVSQLLETLASYQTIRRTTIPSAIENIESDESPAAEEQDSELPSDSERAVYETLKSRLVSIIGSLPPYAVAKVNGDQLGELRVSQKIIVETPDWKGTMEKDDYTLQQERAAAIAAQTNAANRASTPATSRSASFQAPHSGYNQRSFNTNARLSQPQGAQSGFQVPQQNRQPSVPGSYTPAQAVGRPPATPTAQRPGYGSQQFAQTNPQYNQANSAQFPRPTSNGYTPQPYTPRPGQPAAYNTPQGRIPGQVPASAPAQRYQPQYATQTPSQGYPNSAAAAAYARSAAEQAAVTKAQIAAQQGRQSPSTPQPQVEARPSQEGSLTPGSKPNGTPIQS